MTSSTPRVRTEFDTREFEASHWKAPKGRGYWGFRNSRTNEEVWFNGTLTEAKKALAGGLWVVLP
jgi:hypothetical protein